MNNLGRKGLVPWRASHPRAQPTVTLPVFIAYCSVAAALRWWNRKDARFIAILKIPDVDGLKIYKQAAEVFGNGSRSLHKGLGKG